jgi:hypothetical protein
MNAPVAHVFGILRLPPPAKINKRKYSKKFSMDYFRKRGT